MSADDDIVNVLATFEDAYTSVAFEVSICDDRDEGAQVAKETLCKVLSICTSPCGRHLQCSLIHELWLDADWEVVADHVVEDGHWDNEEEDEDDDDE